MSKVQRYRNIRNFFAIAFIALCHEKNEYTHLLEVRSYVICSVCPCQYLTSIEITIIEAGS